MWMLKVAGFLFAWSAPWGAAGAWLGYRWTPSGEDPLARVERFARRASVAGNLILALAPVAFAAYLVLTRPPGPPERDANPFGFATIIIALICLGALTAIAAWLAGRLAALGAAWGHRAGHGVVGAALGSGVGLPLALAGLIGIWTAKWTVVLLPGLWLFRSLREPEPLRACAHTRSR